MIKINNDDVVKLELILERLGGRAIPHAQRAAINAIAFDGRKQAIENVGESMTLRNKWTAGSIRVSMARRPGDHAELGSFADYLATQETGGTISPGAIQTPTASGEGDNAKPRKKLARGANRARAIQLRQPRLKNATTAQKNAAAVTWARKNNQRFVFMETRRGAGIFRVTKTNVRMMYDLSVRTATIRPRRWLAPAGEAAMSRREEHYAKALDWQIKHLK